MSEYLYESLDAWDAAGQPPRDAYKEHIERKRAREAPVPEPEKRETVAEKSARLSTWPAPKPESKSEWPELIWGGLSLLGHGTLFFCGIGPWLFFMAIALGLGCVGDGYIGDLILEVVPPIIGIGMIIGCSISLVYFIHYLQGPGY